MPQIQGQDVNLNSVKFIVIEMVMWIVYYRNLEASNIKGLGHKDPNFTSALVKNI